jgi:acetoacetyl-CoA synthetase
MFFQTSCAWMMWNWQLSALASGVEIVLYDGPISDAQALWRIVAEERVTVFGTSPAYLKLCEDAAIAPGREFDLSSLRSVLSTGSILHAKQFHWVRDHVKPLPLQSISGGTDIIGCFLLGNPNLPVIAGQSQCKGLGHDLRALLPHDTAPGGTESGRGGQDAGGFVGELVCANPFPSRPLGFFGDNDGARFHAAYFVQHPGFWAHGDLVEFTAEDGAILHGRSDGVLKARGIRVGPAEIYRVLHESPEIRDAMAVEQRVSAEFVDGRIILLLVLQNGLVLDGHLVAQLRRRLTEQASAAHVPDLFLQVDALPMTQNGKQSEAAASDLVNGRPIRNASALRNPESLAALRAHPGLWAAAMPVPTGTTEGLDIEQQLQQLWESLFNCSPIGWNDDFFELGGNSLLAARLCVEIRQQMGHDLPLTTVHAAPTIGTLATLIRDKAGLPSPRLVLLHPGEGAPLFFVHSVVGTVTQFWALGRAMRSRRPVYAIQARGIEPGEQAHQHVQDMAAEYLGIIRSVQPHGPYLLGGFSFGGLVALEMAQQATRANETIAFLAMVDTTVHERFLPPGQWLRYRLQRPVRDLRRMLDVPRGQRSVYVAEKSAVMLDRLRVRLGGAPKHLDLVGDLLGDAHLPPNLRRVRGGAYVATRTYRPRSYGGKLTYFSATERGRVDPLPLWRRIAKGGVEIHVTPGDHFEMIQEPNVSILARCLDRCLDALGEPDPVA